MANNNSYSGQPRRGSDVCSLMRRINALEDVDAGVEDTGDLCSDGTYVWQVMEANHIVTQHTVAGEYVRTIGTFGVPDSSAGGLYSPRCVCVYGSTLFIADAGTVGPGYRVQLFDLDGVYQSGIDLSPFYPSYAIIDMKANATHLYLFIFFGPSNGALVKVTHAGSILASAAWSNAGGNDRIGITSSYLFFATSAMRRYDLNLVFDTSFSMPAGARTVYFDCDSSNVYLGINVVFVGNTTKKYDEDMVLISQVAPISHGLSVSGPKIYIHTALASPNVKGINSYTMSTQALVDSWLTTVPSGSTQTEFFSYDSATSKSSLGTPDSGVEIPALGGIDNSIGAAQVIIDMREALETVVQYWSAGEGEDNQPYVYTFDEVTTTWNLYKLAMGDRSDYGATGGERFTWTRTLDEMIDTDTFDIDIGEIDACVTYLEDNGYIVYSS